jgi:hypothetical protein
MTTWKGKIEELKGISKKTRKQPKSIISNTSPLQRHNSSEDKRPLMGHMPQKRKFSTQQKRLEES